MFLGFLSALLARRRESEAPADAPDPGLSRRVDELAGVVAQLRQHLDAAAKPPAQIEAITSRVEQLERRVDQLATEMPAAPPLEQVLAAVEQMVSAKIGGLDERLTDQVHAIELLRRASGQTDALLQRLIQAVESLTEQPESTSSVTEMR
jgi:outer membrane murein-binding lipoprotein Lpp